MTTLDSLRKQYPDHSQIIKYLLNIYQQSGDWPRLKQLLPDIKRRKVLTKDALQAITLKVHRKLLLTAVKERDLPALQQLWQELPRQYQQDTELVSVYAGHLLDLHADDAAEVLIKDATARNWDKHLAYLYGNLRDGDAVKQLETVEAWLQAVPER